MERDRVPSRVDPITGKRVKVRDYVDAVDPRKLPYKVMVSETAKAAQDMADIRYQWANMDMDARAGHEGYKLRQRYNYLSHRFLHLTGQEPVPIYADQ